MEANTRFAIILAAALPLGACSPLKSRLLSADPLVRADALSAAAKAKESKKDSLVEYLKKKVGRGTPDRRAYAAAALEDIGPAAAAAAPELFAAMAVPNPDISGPAGRALKKLDGAAPFLASRLASGVPAERSRAAELLLAHGEAAVPSLVRNFEQGDRALAAESIVVLARMGPAAGSAVPAMVRAAVSQDDAIRGLARSALVDIGQPAGLWLAEALRSPNTRYRLGASIVLAGLYDPPAEALDTLAGAVWDEDPGVKRNAAAALAAYTPQKLAALPDDRISGLITAAAQTGEAAVLSARALLKSGKAPQYWVEASLISRSSETRRDAALALLAMSPPPPTAAAPLLKALQDPSRAVRKAAAEALGKYSVNAAASFPPGTAAALGEALKDSAEEIRLLALIPLGRRAASDAEALAILAGALSHTDAALRIGAAEQLQILGAKAVTAEKALWKMFGSRDCRQKSAAAKALSAVKPKLKKLPAVAKARSMICTPGQQPPEDPAALPGMSPKKSKPAAPKKKRKR